MKNKILRCHVILLLLLFHIPQLSNAEVVPTGVRNLEFHAWVGNRATIEPWWGFASGTPHGASTIIQNTHGGLLSGTAWRANIFPWWWEWHSAIGQSGILVHGTSWLVLEDVVARMVVTGGDGGLGYGTSYIRLRSGDVLDVVVRFNNLGADYKNGQITLTHNEETVLDTYLGFGEWNRDMLLRLTDGGFRVVNPIVTESPDLLVKVGDNINWGDGIYATWGHSTTRTIPTEGEVRVLGLTGGIHPALTDNAFTYTKIGTAELDYAVRDLHSLGLEFPYDDSFTTVSRKITVYTDECPEIKMSYADGIHIYSIYTPNGPLPCGGEFGWTNESIDISVEPGAIIGTFDTRLTLPDVATSATNAIATRPYYHIESTSALGTPISGVLTAVGDASNLLSATVTGFVKIDKTNPIPAATHVSGYNFIDDSTDVLSGLSVTRPSKIAFSAPSGLQPAPGDFSTFDTIPTMPDGTYDVWVRSTDKAGNTATERVLLDILLLNGTVELAKDTDQGATLHIAGCPDFDSVSITSCTPECSVGANVEIEEKSPLTYNLTLTNTDLSDMASGTFEDYLPEGTIISTIPTVTPAGSATVTFDIETTGPYTGRYKVSGTYTDLAPGGQIEIDILTRAPAFDKVTAMNNIITNQASTNWTIGTGPTERSGSTDSNYAVHELLEIPSVETLFTKVGANDLDVGLSGAEFALYRWNGALDPTTAELNHIIDYNVLVDNSLPGGDWVRVTYDGEDALALTDIFVSSASPLGEVDLGSLPEGVYTLIESNTVGGYALPMGQWILIIDPGKGDTGVNDWKIEFAGKSNSIAPPAAIRDESVPNAPTYKIVNAEPFLIGLSGLEGTTGMLLTGFIIMAIATNAYLVRRHKQREKQM